MPQVTIMIGGRDYTVACGAGEEAHLQKAAKALNAEAERLAASGQSLPENTVLLMSGLMLADQVIASPEGGAAVADEAAAAKVAQMGAEISAAKSANEALAKELESAKAALAAAEEAAKTAKPDLDVAEKVSMLTEERDAARDEVKALRAELASAAAAPGINGDHAVLERMAVELERLADEIESGSIQAKAS